MESKSDWRKKEPSLQEVIKKYPQISPFVILKTDIQRRGVYFTREAIGLLDPERDQIVQSAIFTEQKELKPVGINLRDGTGIVYFDTGENRKHREAYKVDAVDGKLVLVDEDRILDEVEFWPKADYFNGKTSSGKPMWQILTARPQRIDIAPNRYCHFWDKPGNGCKYCPIGALGGERKKNHEILELEIQDVYEAVGEALKQKGRFNQIVISSGSILSGSELLEDEVELHIKVLQAVGRHFKTEKFPSQLIGTAYSKRQLERLYKETGLMSYTADIEVLNEDIFKRLCPGKAEFIGYKEWKKRLFEGVEIFGKGRINTGIVSGVELAEGIGFTSEEEAYQVIRDEAEEFYDNGVSVALTVWNPAPGTILHKCKNPSLDYYVKLSAELERLRKKYDLLVDFDDYRRCGNHPNTDLARI